jgi:purine-binding chemotaxis protein CheW
MPSVETAANPGQYLTFLVAGEEYATPVGRLREVVSFTGATRVPAAPAWIRGVMNLRGRVVPVIDLAVKLGRPETIVTSWACVLLVDVLLEGEPAALCLLTERVGQVIELSAEDLRPAPAFGTRVHARYLAGLGRFQERLLPVLDIERVLALAELLGAPSSEPDASGPSARAATSLGSA